MQMTGFNGLAKAMRSSIAEYWARKWAKEYQICLVTFQGPDGSKVIGQFINGQLKVREEK
jgi:hypothetical protein